MYYDLSPWVALTVQNQSLCMWGLGYFRAPIASSYFDLKVSYTAAESDAYLNIKVI